MSNYTAKRRAGGGRLVGQQVNSITTINVDVPNDLNINYEKNVSAAQVKAEQFVTGPNGIHGTAVVATGANQLTVTFATDPSGEANVTATQNQALFISPQTVPIL